MGQRVLYGALSLLVLLGIVYLDALISTRFVDRTDAMGRLLARGLILPLFVIAVLFAGSVELIHLLRAAGAQPYSRFAMLMTGLVGVVPWLSFWFAGSGGDSLPPVTASMIGVLITVLGGGLIAVFRLNPAGCLRDLGATFLVVLYLGFLGSFVLHIRCDLYGPGSKGAWVILAILFTTKAADIGAYFAGSLWGRHKLIPSISPGKSVEGMFGGLALSALVSWLAWSLLATSFTAENGAVSRIQGPSFAFPMSLVFGLLLSASAQLGDLLESCFKRDAGLKDSGKVIPRFGGILDLVDSPILAMPVAWLLLTWG